MAAGTMLADGISRIRTGYIFSTDRNLNIAQETAMPGRTAKKEAEADCKAGKSPSTQAGHFVEAEIEAKRKHQGPAKTDKQTVAIGLQSVQSRCQNPRQIQVSLNDEYDG